MPIEIWKDIPGYDGIYQFSNLDRVRTVDHYDLAHRFVKGRILKPHITRKCVCYGLSKNREMVYVNVNRLKSELFPTDDADNGEWKPVVGFEEYYEVSKDGRIRSLEYTGVVNGKTIHRYPKELKQHMSSDGYPMVKLRDNRQHAVHRLVAEAFVPCDDYSLDVDHIDGDRTNNNASNLRFITHADNIRHTIELGRRLIGNNRGKNYNAKPVVLKDPDGCILRFDCAMDAAEYIRASANIETGMSSLYTGIMRANKTGNPYYGFLIKTE